MSDFLVIGGGIAGLAAGRYLSNLGRVTVLEAEEALGYHTSGRSAALYEEGYGAPAVAALNRATKPALQAGGYLSPRGLLLVGTAGNTAEFDRDFAHMQMQPLTVAELRQMVPVFDPAVVTRGGFEANAFDIDTARLLQDHAREIRAAGGSVVTKARVSSIARTAGGWAVESTAGSFEGRTLVNAAGSWADSVAALAGVPPLGLQPYRRSMARIPAPGGHDVSRWPMIFGPGEDWYAKPDAGALIVSPAEEHPMDPHDAWPEDLVLAEGLAKWEAHVTEPVTRLLASWAGLRTFARDRVLVLGPDPAAPGFVWSAGQGGYGFQTSAGAARLVADLVGGRAPELPAEIVAALRPDRLRG